MKITSFLGALGLAASVFFLFYQFWGKFSTGLQVFIVSSAPIITLIAVQVASKLEKTGYFSKLFGLVSFTCFALNLSVLGQIFNITPSPNALLLLAAFAFVIAYAADVRLLLAFGIMCITAFLSAKTGVWNGCYWINFGERPENFFPASILLFLVSLIPHHYYSGFGVIYRVFAMLIFFLPVLVLSNWGAISYWDVSRGTVEVVYQIIGFLFSAGAIWLGIKRSWSEVVNTGNVFFTIFLYTKFFDWWWNWMPKYLFFLVIGLSAIVLLLIFKRLRNTENTGKEAGS